MVLADAEGGRLEQRERAGGLGSAGGGEGGAQPAVGVADEVGAVAQQGGDVLGVDQVVLGLAGAGPVAAPVRGDELEALAGQRQLLGPLLGGDGQRAVHQHHPLALAPLLDVQADGAVAGLVCPRCGHDDPPVASAAPCGTCWRGVRPDLTT